MKLVIYSNFLNLHQVHVMDEFYKLLGDDFRFVATLQCNETMLKGGEDYSKRPYCLLAAESESSHMEALYLARESEVCVFGACSQEYAVERAIKSPLRLSFEMGERWLKHGWLTIGSPVFRQWLINYYRYFRKANFYKLCCSSFAAIDDEKLHAYRGRHYKWGYFTKVEKKCHETSNYSVSMREKVRILWCARFLLLKHPELVVELASRLKNDGYNFAIDMYGDDGQRAKYDKVYPREKLMKLIKERCLNDVVTLMGNRSNPEILEAMKNGDIFLFTSDRLEGWGAVANESMANGCVLVASDAIGSTGYLVKDKETGIVFKSQNIESLYEGVKFLLDNPGERERIANAGRQSMSKLWNPENAARCLLQLIEDLKAGRETSVKNGPCSVAN